MNCIGQAHHDLLGYYLDGTCKVHFAPGDFRFPFPRWSIEEFVEPAIGHGKACGIVEIIHVQPESPVLLEIKKIVHDQVHKAGLAIRRKAHELIFAGIYLESRVISKCGIEEAQGMRKIDLPERGEPVSFPVPGGCCSPFAHPVQAENSGILKRTGEKGGSSVGLMVLGKKK